MALLNVALWMRDTCLFGWYIWPQNTFQLDPLFIFRATLKTLALCLRFERHPWWGSKWQGHASSQSCCGQAAPFWTISLLWSCASILVVGWWSGRERERDRGRCHGQWRQWMLGGQGRGRSYPGVISRWGHGGANIQTEAVLASPLCAVCRTFLWRICSKEKFHGEMCTDFQLYQTSIYLFLLWKQGHDVLLLYCDKFLVLRK